jgi:hypothetical protein
MFFRRMGRVIGKGLRTNVSFVQSRFPIIPDEMEKSMRRVFPLTFTSAAIVFPSLLAAADGGLVMRRRGAKRSGVRSAA